MKKWKEYTPQEKRMIIVMIILVIVVVISWSRVEKGIKRGNDIFFNTPADTVKTDS